MNDRGCTTADCAGLPVRLVKLFDDGPLDNGPYPYCSECAGVLLDSDSWGEQDCGPYNPVTEEMVERAAFALWAHDFEDHMGFPARREAWPDSIENPAKYRTWAGIALVAALHWNQKPEEGR